MTIRISYLSRWCKSSVYMIIQLLICKYTQNSVAYTGNDSLWRNNITADGVFCNKQIKVNCHIFVTLFPSGSVFDYINDKYLDVWGWIGTTKNRSSALRSDQRLKVSVYGALY